MEVFFSTVNDSLYTPEFFPVSWHLYCMQDISKQLTVAVIQLCGTKQFDTK
jgi:hypothetical protein